MFKGNTPKWTSEKAGWQVKMLADLRTYYYLYDPTGNVTETGKIIPKGYLNFDRTFFGYSSKGRL